MSWIVLHFIGIISYAASGAFVALEAEYSFIGVYALGLTTAFGGALVRNLIIGVPVTELWDHSIILTVLCAVCTWLGWSTPLQLTLIVLVVIALRMSAIRYQWRLHLPCNLKKGSKVQMHLRMQPLGKKSIGKSIFEKAANSFYGQNQRRKKAQQVTLLGLY